MFCGGGGESITGKRAAYTVYGNECKLAVDDDKSRNMNMVPKGAKCGENKVKVWAWRHITWSFFMSYVACFAQNRMFVRRFALTTNVWIYQFTGGRRNVRRNATTTEWVSSLCLFSARRYWAKVQIQLLASWLSKFYCIFISRCVITRKSASVIRAGLRLTATSSMQIYLKVHAASLRQEMFAKLLEQI